MKKKLFYIIGAIASIWAIGFIYGLATGSLRIEFGSKTEDNSRKVDDGPYIIYKGDTVVVSYFQKGRHLRATALKKELVGRKFQVIGDSSNRFSISLKNPLVPNVVISPSAEKILAISDIEGNFYALKNILLVNGVIDDNYNWAYGTGRMVIIGDLVDRGLYVTQCLWLIYKLEDEARKAGGGVHYLLGNHETMIMAGDTRYVRNKYHELSDALHLDISQSIFGKQGEFGRWFRNKNVIEKIGTTLFVHGGLSYEFYQKKFSLEKINKIAKQFYGNESREEDLEDAKIIFGEDGPLWYRGYTKEKISQKQTQEILSFYGAERIVFGHSIVDNIKLFNNNKLIGIDVIQPDKPGIGHASALLIENNRIMRLLAMKAND